MGLRTSAKGSVISPRPIEKNGMKTASSSGSVTLSGATTLSQGEKMLLATDGPRRNMRDAGMANHVSRSGFKGFV